MFKNYTCSGKKKFFADSRQKYVADRLAVIFFFSGRWQMLPTKKSNCVSNISLE